MIKPRCPIADFKLSICLFGAVKLNKNADLIKMYILVMVSDSMHVHNFYREKVDGVKIWLYLVLIWAHSCLLEIKRKIP